MAEIIIEETENIPDARILNIYRPVPPNGKKCPVTGMGHSGFYSRIINDPKVRQKVRIVQFKKPHQTRAQCFYHVGDLLQYFNELAEQQRADVEVDR